MIAQKKVDIRFIVSDSRRIPLLQLYYPCSYSNSKKFWKNKTTNFWIEYSSRKYSNSIRGYWGRVWECRNMGNPDSDPGEKKVRARADSHLLPTSSSPPFFSTTPFHVLLRTWILKPLAQAWTRPRTFPEACHRQLSWPWELGQHYRCRQTLS